MFMCGCLAYFKDTVRIVRAVCASFRTFRLTITLVYFPLNFPQM
uniref:Uncharacterized protein n=1 Tax=Ciona intestinalis TaxID=7719 RepID=H2XL25_CIOIN